MVARFDSQTKRNVASIFSNGYSRNRLLGIAVPCLVRMHLMLKNLRRRGKRMMGKLQVNIGRAGVEMDAPRGQDNSLLTAYTWLAMFVGQIGISVRKADAFRPGIWFRCAAHFKTRFFRKRVR